MSDTRTQLHTGHETDAAGKGAAPAGGASAPAPSPAASAPTSAPSPAAAATMLDGADVAAFCEGCAIMLAAGIQTDEAVHMLADNMADTPLRRTCLAAYREICAGRGLADAMRATGVFPAYALELTAIGERSGRLENVLRSLAVYYDEEARMFAKLRASIGYPAALLCVMSGILAFTVIGILPVFMGVYEQLAGGLAGGSFGAVQIALVVGWTALVLTLIVTACALAGAAAVRKPQGRQRILALLDRLPVTRDAMGRLALSRFASAASAYLASGADSNVAMREAAAAVSHEDLRAQLESALAAMTDPARGLSFSQAVTEFGIFEPVYARMLAIGSRAGSIDGVLEQLSATFFDDATERLDRAIDAVEPALAALLTVSVGATLIAVMLPLVGMMGAIG